VSLRFAYHLHMDRSFSFFFMKWCDLHPRSVHAKTPKSWIKYFDWLCLGVLETPLPWYKTQFFFLLFTAMSYGYKVDRPFVYPLRQSVAPHSPNSHRHLHLSVAPQFLNTNKLWVRALLLSSPKHKQLWALLLWYQPTAAPIDTRW
jgi:hypothetical protein